MIPFFSNKVEQFRKKNRIDQTKSSEIIIALFKKTMIFYSGELRG
jgi:hypothetical protein